MSRHTLVAAALVSAALLAPFPGRAARAPQRDHPPEHRATRELIALVEDAAALIAAQGTAAACRSFRTKDSPWLFGEVYVFVLDLEGRALCHPARPRLEGQPLIDLEDPDGRRIVRMMLRELEGGADDGWLHYLWPRPGWGETFFWKTSYVRRAVEPEGDEVLVGSGLYRMPMERFFAVEQVEDAAGLLGREGEAAFEALRDPASGFRFYDAYVFVMDEAGNHLVNAAFPGLEGRNLLDLEDPSGKAIGREILAALADREAAWVDYLWPRPGDTRPARKSTYVRRVEVDGRVLIVGAGVYLE